MEGLYKREWYHYGARYYDPAIARWFAIDPLAYKYPSLSPYNYVANNPLRYIDPNGEELYVFGEQDESLKDLQNFVGDDASRLSNDQDGRVIINTEGYEGGNDNLDALIMIDGAKDSDGNNVLIGYAASTKDIAADDISSNGQVKSGGITNASSTPRAGEGDVRYPGLPTKYPHGVKPSNGFDGEVTISTRVEWSINGAKISRSQVQGHELMENLYRTRNGFNYWLSHGLANTRYFGGNSKNKVASKPIQ